jgi:HSP20 family molecular chaperone IbpA
MTDEDDKDYDDFIRKIMDDLDVDADAFDAEFIIFPNKELNKKFGLDPNQKGFKVNFHYEEGMDKPEIRISKRDDLDKEKLKDLLKKMKFARRAHPSFKKMMESRMNQEESKPKKVIDANKISLKPPNDPEMEQTQKNVTTKEPDLEIQDLGDQVRVILEVPGVRENDLYLSLNEEKNVLTFNADNNKKSYYKQIHLPTKCSIVSESIAINNGILTITLTKKNCQAL